MHVLKVIAEGFTTSFRYPHFMHEVQPTYEMSPPATIYGHICSVLGEWFDPKGVQFAIHFTFQARFKDVEHIHLLGRGRGKMHDTFPKVLEGEVNPFTRELLFRPKLVLYINRPEWVDAFRSPRYAVALGRSQDLFTYRQVSVIEIQQAENAYFEHTLAPYSFAKRTARGIVVLMPRFLDYRHSRFPTFDRYVILRGRVHTSEFLRFEGEPPVRYWIDPTSPVINGDHLGLAFHNWVEEDESPLCLARMA
jgi:CRISPR-associated protein Cas5t